MVIPGVQVPEVECKFQRSRAIESNCWVRASVVGSLCFFDGSGRLRCLTSDAPNQIFANICNILSFIIDYHDSRLYSLPEVFECLCIPKLAGFLADYFVVDPSDLQSEYLEQIITW